MKTFEQFLEEADAKIPVDGQYGVKMALKRVKNQSDVTRKVKAANPTHQVPHGSSQHAAYSKESNPDDELVSVGTKWNGGDGKKPKEYTIPKPPAGLKIKEKK